MKNLDVSEEYEIEVKLKITGDDDEGTVIIRFIALKVSGKWILTKTNVEEGEFIY